MGWNTVLLSLLMVERRNVTGGEIRNKHWLVVLDAIPNAGKTRGGFVMLVACADYTIGVLWTRFRDAAQGGKKE
ncbi:hypothetical protein BJ170DRAFT_457091 [Xylariales sp. AK1849]|nr:hypothetical protein BJ170DRAFT_457091 [Xylariales sp. AK1849]